MPVVIGTPMGVTASAVYRSKAAIPVTGLVGWWDADDASTFTMSGANATQWRDKSANACHMTSIGTGVTRTVIQNGRTGVVMPSGGWCRSAAPATTAIDNITMFAVCMRDAGHATQSAVMINGQATNYAIALRANGANTGIYVAPGVGWVASAIPDDGAANFHMVQRSTGTWSHYVNGSATTATSTGSPGVPATRTSLWDVTYAAGGAFFEAIIYDRVLSVAERQQVEGYLQTKWGIYPPPAFPLTLPWHSAFWASDPKWSKPADGGTVPSWRNAGTSGVAAVQATGTKQPVYRASYAALNGKPALEFDGVDDLLDATTASISQPNHVFAVVWKNPASTAFRAILDGNTARHMIRDSNNTTIELVASSVVSFAAGGSGPTALAALFNGASSEVRRNGVAYGSATSVGTTQFGGMRIGAQKETTSWWQGAIAFVGVINRALTAAEIEDLENWARAFYGVPVTPPIPTTGLQGWWDADDDTSFTYSSGTVVSQWNDKSGLGRHLTRTTVSEQPSRSGTRNGRPTVAFGGDDYMNWSGDTGVNVATVTIFVVAAEAVEKAGAGLIQIIDSGSVNDYNNTNSVSTETNDTTKIAACSRNWGGASNTSYVAGTGAMPWGAYVFTFDSDTYQRTYRDGVEGTPATGRAGTYGIARGGYIVAGRYQSGVSAGTRLSGDIAEIIVYDRVLTDAERNQVQGYLQTKWGTPIAPGATTELAGWYDAADASTFTYGTAPQVASWIDKSPNAFTVSRTPSTAVVTGATINGLPAANFNGTGVLTRAGVDIRSYLNFAGTDAMTFMVVQGLATNKMIPQIGVVIDGTTLVRLQGAVTMYADIPYAAGGGRLAVAHGANMAGPLLLIAAYRNGANMAIQINGTQVGVKTTATGAAVSAPGTLNLGWSNLDTLNANVGEIMHVARYDPTDFAAISQYLSDKWAIPVTSTPGLVGWWDASDITAFTIPAGDGKITGWNDKSGNGNHMTQPSSNLTYRATVGTRTLNGRNVVDFDGVANAIGSASLPTPQPYTVIAVAQSDLANASGIRPLLSASPRFRQNGTNWNPTAGINTWTSGPADILPHVHVVNFQGASSTHHVDGVALTPGDAGVADVSAISLGTGSTSWDGTVAEVIFYNRALTTAERLNIEGYLRRKWGTK